MNFLLFYTTRKSLLLKTIVLLKCSNRYYVTASTNINFFISYGILFIIILVCKNSNIHVYNNYVIYILYFFGNI